jgi:hypothetical protein
LWRVRDEKKLKGVSRCYVCVFDKVEAERSREA